MRNEGSRARFDFVTITLHWLTATLIAFQAATGLTLEFARDSTPTLPLLDLHRSAGTMVWFLALTRIVWRGTFAKFPPFPEWMSNIQKWIATKIEYFLYGLLLLQPLTGVTTTLVLGEPFHLFFWTVPPLVHRNLDLWESMLSFHRVGAYCLFAVVGGHAGMALLHHYVFRDEVLERMAPWVRQKSPIAVSNASATKAAETWVRTSPSPRQNLETRSNMLEGKTALVTGSTSGIGSHIADALAADAIIASQCRNGENIISPQQGGRTMARKTTLFIGPLMAVLCAVSNGLAANDTCLPINRILSTKVTDRNTIVVTTIDRKLYTVHLRGACIGLDQTARKLSFRTKTELGCLSLGDSVSYNQPAETTPVQIRGSVQTPCFVASVGAGPSREK